MFLAPQKRLGGDERPKIVLTQALAQALKLSSSFAGSAGPGRLVGKYARPSKGESAVAASGRRERARPK